MTGEEQQPLLSEKRDPNEDGDFPVFSRPGHGQLTPQKNIPGPMGSLDYVVAIFLPWLIYTLVVALFVYAYYAHRWLVWSIVGMCLLLGALMVARGAGQWRSIHLAVGLLCLTATCIGTSVGVYLYDTYASEYWQLQDGAEYRHVSPASKGRDYADATILTFTPDAFVDGTRTLGYMEAGVVYCVAPVTTQKFSSMPQYWSVGKDCCDQRTNNHCGDAHNPAAKTGVLVQDEREREKYTTAIRMAEAVYNLSPTDTGRFALTWTATTDTALKVELWSSCRTLYMLSVALYFFCSVLATLLLSKTKSVRSAF